MNADTEIFRFFMKENKSIERSICFTIIIIIILVNLQTICIKKRRRKRTCQHRRQRGRIDTTTRRLYTKTRWSTHLWYLWLKVTGKGQACVTV